MGFHRRHPGSIRLDALLWLTALILIACAALTLKPRPAPPPSLLDRQITEINLDGVPLDRAIVRIETASGVRIVYDKQALDSDYLKTPVYLHLRNVKLAVVLSHLPMGQIVLENEAAAVRMTSLDAMPAYVRIYDVREIVDRMMASRYVPSIEEASAGPQVAPAPASARRSPRDEFTEMLANIFLGWDRWNPWQMERTQDGRIILLGPRPTHEAFEALLRRLRECDRVRPWTPRPPVPAP